MTKQEVTYQAAGVDTAEGARAVDAIKETVHSTYRPEVVGDIGGFGGLFSIAAAKDMAEPLLVSGTDGVGTKLKVAQLAGKHGTVGIDLVAMCVNDILACGAEPLFFLDYIAIGKLRKEHVAESSPASARAAVRLVARLSAAKWPSTRASWIPTTTTCPASPWALSTSRRCSIPKACPRATCSSAWHPRVCTPTAIPLPARCAWRAKAAKSC